MTGAADAGLRCGRLVRRCRRSPPGLARASAGAVLELLQVFDVARQLGHARGLLLLLGVLGGLWLPLPAFAAPCDRVSRSGLAAVAAFLSSTWACTLPVAWRAGSLVLTAGAPLARRWR